MFIDVTRLVHRAFKRMLPTGVDRVSNAYVEHYGRRAAALVRVAQHWLVLGPRDSRHLFDALLEPGPGNARKLAAYIARGIAWPARYVGPQVLINTGHSGLEHPSYALSVRRRRLLPLYFGHDLIPISHPEYSRAGEDHRHHRRVQTMFETGKALIVNSHATRVAFADYAHAQGLRLPECIVAPLAPAPLPPASEQRPLAENYFVILGTIEPRKNHALLLQLWCGLVQRLGARAPKLVVIGRRGWKCEQVVDLLDRCPVLRGHVLQKPRCSDPDLSTWLRHATALLFPSFTEGFGMPLVEALALGVPVIASDLAVFREIAGAIPEYLEPLDGPGWQRAIEDYAQPDGVRRAEQLQRLRDYATPCWSEHFALVDPVVDQWQRRAEHAAIQGGWAYVPRH
jgi:glycosyltransferase involved in cell wall biosynthesis